MNELVEYLCTMESRMEKLESENSNLRAQLIQVNNAAVSRYDTGSLPRTNLLSKSFLTRAFAVYGHFFVANFIIGLIAMAAYFCLAAVLFGSILDGLPRTP